MRRADLIAELATTLLQRELPHPLRTAIDGVDAAGKTVLGDELGAELAQRGRSVIRLSIDGFHNPSVIRRRRGVLSPEGYFLDSFDYGALVENVLEPLGPGGDLLYRERVFDFRRDVAVESPRMKAPEHAILLFDGVFLLRPEICSYWDFSIFVRTDFAEAHRRAMTRDVKLFGTVEEVRSRYERRYIPGQQLYLDGVRPWTHASVLVDNNDPSDPRIIRSA